MSIPADTAVKKRVEDVMPIATGHEKEELEAELEVFLFLILIWFTRMLVKCNLRRLVVLSY